MNLLLFGCSITCGLCLISLLLYARRSVRVTCVSVESTVMFYVFRVITIIISVKGGFPLIELPTRLFLSLV